MCLKQRFLVCPGLETCSGNFDPQQQIIYKEYLHSKTPLPFKNCLLPAFKNFSTAQIVSSSCTELFIQMKLFIAYNICPLAKPLLQRRPLAFFLWPTTASLQLENSWKNPSSPSLPLARECSNMTLELVGVLGNP